MTMATLHLICGKAASGKTTLARRLVAEHAAALFCEDEWLVRLGLEIADLADYVRHTTRLRAALGPHAIELLRLGVSVVFDFAGNTRRDRAWVRTIFERAGADHQLYYIEASDASCLVRLRRRNETRPGGLYYGEVTEAQFAAVTRHFAEDEGFAVLRHDAGEG